MQRCTDTHTHTSCSTCFGHFYAHHQELETICVLLPPMVCSAWLLVVGGQVQGSRVCVRDEGCCLSNIHIISVINHSVASSWFFFSKHINMFQFT